MARLAWAAAWALLGVAAAESSSSPPDAVAEAGGFSFGPQLLPAFMLAPGFTNLNHGSFGATPGEVIAAQQEWVAKAEARPDQWFREDWYSVLDEVRARLAAYLGAPEEEDVVLVENASSGVNGLLRSLPLGRGDRVVYFNTAYKMVQNTLQWLSETAGVEAVVVNVTFPVQGPDSFLLPLAAALSSSSAPPKLMVFSHITSLPALVLPVAELARLCRSHGVEHVVVDGAHALGQTSVNLTELGVDYWVGNGHKWLYSPKGSAVLYVAKDKQQPLWPEPTVISSKGDPTFVGRYSYVGTRDYSALAAIGQALDFRQRLGGEQAIMEYMRGLSMWAGHYLSELWHTYTLQPDHMTGAMTNVVLPTSNASLASSLAQWLYEQHDTYMVVAALEPSMRPPTTTATPVVLFTRLSAQVYLDKASFERLGQLVLDFLSQNQDPPPQEEEETTTPPPQQQGAASIA